MAEEVVPGPCRQADKGGNGLGSFSGECLVEDFFGELKDIDLAGNAYVRE